MFVTVLQFTPDELVLKEKEFLKALADVPSLEVAKEELEKFFFGKSWSDIRQHDLTYWRWYVAMNWEIFNVIQKESLPWVIASQTPTALLLEIDVLKQLMWYFGANTFTEKDRSALYLDVQVAFLNSDFILGDWKGQEVTIKTIAEEIKTSLRESATSLEKAELNAKVSGLLFAKNNPVFSTYIFAQEEAVVGQFLALVSFFLEVSAETIWEISEAYLHPLASQVRNDLAKKEKTEVQPEVVTTKQNTEPKPTNLEIRMIAERKFEKDDSGDFKEPGDVMGMLDEWATKYNDEKIRELFIFNEQTGSFEWNNQLLTQ